MKTLGLIGILGTVVMLTAGCGKKDGEENLRPAPVVKPPPAPPPIVEKEKVPYVYSGDKFRDPFIPSGQSSAYQSDAIFDPQRAVVKGIVFGGRQKGAVLLVGGSGTYFVRDGRLIDIMGKNVEGFTAKVFVDKVIVQSSDDSIFELKIRSTEDGEDKKS